MLEILNAYLLGHIMDMNALKRTIFHIKWDGPHTLDYRTRS